MHTLIIKDLDVEIDNRKILKNFSLEIHSGEIHAIMGPNGIGKSTLTKVIMGDDAYKITHGTIIYDGEDITKLSVDKRAHLGIFLGMQMPLEDKDMIHRDVNVGFSGGERKKNEILQMYTLNPSLVMLDEIDSGLDVDSLKIVGDNVMAYYDDYNPAILVITHYQRLLDYIKPQFVHIMKNGKIIKSGDASLVALIEEKGYDYFGEGIESNE